MTLAELFDTRYLPHVARTLKPKTVAEYERLARKVVLPLLGARDIASLTLDDAETLHATTAGRVQANRAVALLSGMLTYAVERRLLPGNPCLGLRRYPEQGRETYYTPTQSKAILTAAAACPDIRAKYVALTLLTGARPEELRDSGPSWRHGHVLRTPDGKTGSRTLFLPAAACAILDGLPVLHRRPDDQGYYFPADMNTRRSLDRLTRAAGVPRARRYDLRHTFASALLAAGVSLNIVGRMLGHRKAQTTLRYEHLAPDVGLAAAGAAAARMGA